MKYEEYDERMGALLAQMQESKLNQELARQRAEKDLHVRLTEIEAERKRAISEANLIYRKQVYEVKRAAAEQRCVIWSQMRRLSYEWKDEHGYHISPSMKDGEKGGEA